MHPAIQIASPGVGTTWSVWSSLSGHRGVLLEVCMLCAVWLPDSGFVQSFTCMATVCNSHLSWVSHLVGPLLVDTVSAAGGTRLHLMVFLV